MDYLEIAPLNKTHSILVTTLVQKYVSIEMTPESAIEAVSVIAHKTDLTDHGHLDDFVLVKNEPT